MPQSTWFAHRIDSARMLAQGCGCSHASTAFCANQTELEKYTKIHYDNKKIVVTDDWKDKSEPSIPPYHAHDYMWDENGKRTDRIDRSLTDAEEKAHKDIL